MHARRRRARAVSRRSGAAGCRAPCAGSAALARMSSIGAKSRVERVACARSAVASFHGLPTSARSRRDGALGRGRHAAAADARRAITRRRRRSAKQREHGGDVLVVALADLVRAQHEARRVARGTRIALDELARLRAPSSGSEVERRRAAARACASPRRSTTRRAERDQHRHRIADRRAVGDVAAERAARCGSAGDAKRVPDFGELRVLARRARRRRRSATTAAPMSRCVVRVADRREAPRRRRCR